MTVEGAKDDITGKGQCSAALKLCSSVPTGRKLHLECATAGHYGIFNGSRFREQIAPRVSTFLRSHSQRAQPQAKNRAEARFLSSTTRGAHRETHLNPGSSFEAESWENAA
jgi:poly(3-hydroxybutyrate) depolymerase